MRRVSSASVTPRLLSVSRRTDIPACYGDWFMRRVAEGFAGWEHPFNGRPTRVSLRQPDVWCFAFWSKNFRPFLPHLRALQANGYPCFFNYTITGLPTAFETHVPPAEDALDSLREIAARFSPDHVHWRYDPIVLSDLTPPAWHRARFAELAAALRGHVRRCIVSFVARYPKVARNLATFERASGVRVHDPDAAARRALALDLAAIATAHGMTLHACCNPEVVDGPVLPAACLDAAAIARLYPAGAAWRPAPAATRPGCGCAACTDIGRYDTCPHGCVYCYANADKTRADTRHRLHDPASAFLGRTHEQSQRLLADTGSGRHAGLVDPPGRLEAHRVL